MKTELFGTTQSGQPIQKFTLSNKNGVQVDCIEYGCRIQRLLVPDASGETADVVWGFDDLAAYEANADGQGAFIGRYANRIAGAQVALGGKTFSLLQNEGPNYLHGSLAHRVFAGEALGDNCVSFRYRSPDGEDGFPGNLDIHVVYTLDEGNKLMIGMQATTDADTYVNFTNHSYFNLGGGGTATNTLLTLNADSFVETDAANLPTGRILPAAGGAFDFLQEKPIGQDLYADDPLLKQAGGYDHCFVINRWQPGHPALAAVARHPASGRTLHLYTTQPGVQLYVANHLDGTQIGKNGVPMERYGAFCLETQHFPDSPHFPDFPSTLLKAGERYRHSATLRFSW